MNVQDYAEAITAATRAALGVGSAAALQAWLQGLQSQAHADPAELCPQVWRFVSQQLLRPEHDFSTHQQLFQDVYQPWPTEVLGPRPTWLPDQETRRGHNVTRFVSHCKGDPSSRGAFRRIEPGTWPDVHALSVHDPEAFWGALFRSELRIPFHTPPQRMLRTAAHPDACVWLPGARMNVAWCGLHALRAGRQGDDAPAAVWADEADPANVRSLTRRQLREAALHVAACLRRRGLKPGDAVAIVLPFHPLAAAAYLGCVLAGCPAVSVAESFSGPEIEARLRISKAKLVITQDVVVRGGKALPLLPRVTSGQGAPPAVVVPGGANLTALLQRPWTSPGAPHPTGLRPCDVSWTAFVALVPPDGAAHDAALPPSATPACLHVAGAQEATNILFSSGTTGEPKAIVWDHVAPLRCGADGWAHQGIQPGQVVAWPTSLGWMMGPWLLYASLLNGAAFAMYGGAPSGRDFGQFLQAARVAVLGLVPSIVKAWRASGCMHGLEWPDLRCISSTGEASSPDDYLWLYGITRYRVPVIEYCGGTELAGGYVTGSMLQAAAPSTFTTPAVGTQLVLLVVAPAAGDGGQEAGRQLLLRAHGEEGLEPCVGEVALAAPTLGCSQRLLNKDHSKVYYEGMPVWLVTGRVLRRHGDELARLPRGFYTALGRVDDTMNLGGIKVASVELERAVVEGVAEVVEAAAIGAPTPGGGPERLVLFVVLRAGEATAPGTATPQLLAACQAAVRSRLNPLFRVEAVRVVAALPRNASNKVMRRILRDTLVRQQGSKL